MINVSSINTVALVKALQEHLCEITFVKVDKSLRTMLCTLKSDVLDASVLTVSYSESSRKDTDPITVWDIEKSAWRSIKPETIIKLEIIA